MSKEKNPCNKRNSRPFPQSLTPSLIFQLVVSPGDSRLQKIVSLLSPASPLLGPAILEHSHGMTRGGDFEECVCVDEFQNDYLENVPLNAKRKDSGGYCLSFVCIVHHELTLYRLCSFRTKVLFPRRGLSKIQIIIWQLLF